MKIIVGSLNPIKIEAVVEAARAWPLPIRGYDQIFGVDARSDVPEQPLSLVQTIEGAHGRAVNARKSPDYVQGDITVGIESGLMKVDWPGMGYVDFLVCACVIRTTRFAPSLGLSGAWQVPHSIMQHVRKGLGINGAALAAGYIEDAESKRGHGLIGILTEGLIVRKDYVRQAVDMALVDAAPHMRER